VAASFQTPTLFLIANDLTRMQVDTNVSESDIGGLRDGSEASFSVEAFPDRMFDGTVSQVRQAPQTVQNVVTYDVVVSADNPDEALKPGMTATVRIVTAKRDNVLRVPDQALRYTPGGVAATAGGDDVKPVGETSGDSGSVWVLRNGRPVRVAVTVGLDDDTNAEILKGDLQPGDRVIVSEQADRGGAGSRQGTSSTPRLRF
jgi:HlyD family secretion protein